MRQKTVSPKARLILHCLCFVCAVICAVLNDSTTLRILWIFCGLLWGFSIVMDIRAIRREQEGTDNPPV